MNNNSISRGITCYGVKARSNRDISSALSQKSDSGSEDRSDAEDSLRTIPQDVHLPLAWYFKHLIIPSDRFLLIDVAFLFAAL